MAPGGMPTGMQDPGVHDPVTTLDQFTDNLD